MSDDTPNPFNIIRYRGDPQKAEFEGVPIVRQESLFIEEWGGLVRCAPYDNHFVFEVPKARKRVGISEYMCTCGAAAVVAKPEDAATRIFVCFFHATYGYHSTGVINKKDFENKDLNMMPMRTGGKGERWLI